MRTMRAMMTMTLREHREGVILETLITFLNNNHNIHYQMENDFGKLVWHHGRSLPRSKC